MGRKATHSVCNLDDHFNVHVDHSDQPDGGKSEMGEIQTKGAKSNQVT